MNWSILEVLKPKHLSMKKITLLTLALALSSYVSNAQYDVNVFNGSDLKANTSGMWITTNTSKAENIEGSYRLYDNDFHKGIITTKDGKKFEVPALNYNIKADQLEAKISEDSVYAFNTSSIVEVDFGKNKFKTLFDPKKYSPTFYEVIGSFNNQTVLKHRTVKVKPGIVNPMTQQKQTPDKFVQEYSYYVTNEKGGLDELKLKKRTILKLFDDSAEEIEDYASKNDLSFKEDADLKKLFNYYNTNS